MIVLPTRPSDIQESRLVCIGRDTGRVLEVEIVTPTYARLSDGHWYSKDNLFRVV